MDPQNITITKANLEIGGPEELHYVNSKQITNQNSTVLA
jgi:hypothetical protein